MILLKTKFTGVYFRESVERNYKGKPDRCFYIKYYKHKKQVQEVVGWLSEGYSAQLAANTRTARLGTPFNTTEDITFDKAFKLFLDWAKVNKKSWKDDEQRYDLWIKKFFANILLKDIRSSDVNDFLIQLKRYLKPDGSHYTPQTIKHYANLIRRIFNFAKQSDRFGGDNPASSAKVQLEKFDNTRLSYLLDDEVARVIKVCEDPLLVNKLDSALIKFAIFTGFRRSELFGLVWENVDLDKGIIYLTETKGKKNQTIILPGLALNILRSLGKDEGEPYVFPSIKGGKRNDVKKLWARVKTFANVRKNITFHDIRHTFGTMAISNGVPLDVLQKIMTHKDIKTTQRYAHIVDKRLHDAADAIDTAFKGLSSAPACAGDEVKSRAK